MDSRAYLQHREVEDRHFWFVGRRAIVEAALQRARLGPGARLLEVGAGTGGNLAMLARLGEVVATEPDDGARAICAARGIGTVVAGLDEAGGPFDAALLLDVLEHLDDPAGELARVRQRLKAGGALVVTVPAHHVLFGAHDRFLHHRRRYAEATLRLDLESAGFASPWIGPMNAVSLAPAAALRAVEAARQAIVAAPDAARGMGLPPPPVNDLLAALLGAEARFVGERRLPFGLSLIALATAPRGQP